MANKLFDLERGQLVIRPETIGIPAFLAIWNSDKTKDKTEARRKLQYIYYLVDFNSPYNVHPEPVRKEILDRDFWGGKPPKDPKILAAVEAYKEFHQTTSMYLLEQSRAAARKLGDYFSAVDFFEKDEKGQLVYKVTDVKAALKEIGNIVDSLIKVENKVKKEVTEASAIRGGGSVGAFEDPD